MTMVCCAQVFFFECAALLGGDALVVLPPCKQDNSPISIAMCFSFRRKEDELYHQIYLVTESHNILF